MKLPFAFPLPLQQTAVGICTEALLVKEEGEEEEREVEEEGRCEMINTFYFIESIKRFGFLIA